MRERQAGLTLIETLVVLSIIGIMAGVTVLSLGALDRRADGGAEAARLLDRLRLASDLAMVSGTPMALTWNARGYAFLGWDAAQGGWRPSESPLLGDRRELPAPLRLERADGGGRAPLMISPDLPGSAAVLRVVGGATSWAVTFDGVGGSAGPEQGL